MKSTDGKRSSPNWGTSAVILTVLLTTVLLARLHNYLLFHWFVEFFSVVVAFGVFTIFWNARHFLDNGCFLFVGIGSLFVGLIDLLHAMAYEGMGVFDQGGANLATQLWIAGRFVQAGSFLAAPLLLRTRFDARLVLGVYAVVTALLLASVFYWQVFPVCFIKGHGLTLFKIRSEYLVSSLLLVSLVLLYQRRQYLDRRVLQLLSITILLTVASELVFTFYQDVTGPANLIGHCLKLVASYTIYVAFVEVGLTHPYSVLFRNMRESEQRLRDINETLEQRVAERTLVAEHRAAQLRALASELTLAEQRERRRLAQVLHDHLQQLLVAAKLKVGLLKKRIENPEHRDRLVRVDELLDESIGVSRSLTVELSPPVLYDAGFTAAMDWLARQMKEKHGFVVQLEAETGIEPATEDLRIFLFGAVRELLFNVVKHGGTSEACVRILATDDGDLQIVVEDQGVGMTPKPNESPTRESGFGLFSIRERLELAGGRLEIDSSVNRGTRIQLTVPGGLAKKSPRPAAAHADQPSKASDGQGNAKPIHRILLADDHIMFRKGLGNLLREHPDLEIVAEAGDGLSAVKLARELSPDVILMDVSMPELSGIEATQRVREFLPNARIVGLSMHEEDDMAQSMLDAGANVYLRKDGSLEHLLAAIRNGQ